MEDETINITIDDILEDLKLATVQETKEGITAAEFAEILGIGEKKAYKMLKKLLHSGKLKCTRVQIKDIAGRPNNSFIYHP
ncbi:MAG: helix-turn-helix domain-containing protein [Richelia sp. SL_2_1]|nr:helix-turn-helix domain-containing protein [Richelia sp. SL_2_1]